MSTAHEYADLILRLYDMRRETVMRQARTWWATQYHPTTAAEAVAGVRGEHGAYFRQVAGYWNMACALVRHGAIDAEVFNDCNQEHIFIFAKVEPFLAELRKEFGPNLLRHVEAVVRALPHADEMLKNMRVRQAAMAASARS